MHCKDLKLWQRATDLTTEIYRLTKRLPEDERYGLTNQLRHAVASIPSNIAKAYDCSDEKQLQFLSVARGSLAVVETQLLICIKLNYLDRSETDKALRLCTEIGKILAS